MSQTRALKTESLFSLVYQTWVSSFHHAHFYRWFFWPCCKKWCFERTLKLVLYLSFSQAKWKFKDVDCIEPDVPMVDICSYKPDCLFKNNIFCNKFRSMRFFLHAFSAMRHDQHCLAFAFTYRETSDFQGIAWIKVRLSTIKISVVKAIANSCKFKP